MAKKTRRKKVHKKSLSHYWRALFFSLVVGVIVFLGGKYFLKPQFTCANSRSCESDLSLKVENGAIGLFAGRKIPAPVIDLASENTKLSVLGTNAPNPQKHIYVDLASQILYAYDGNNKFLQTFISSGRWNKTPVGNFHIWTKIRSTRMSGGSGDDAYDLPNVPYVMYFYHDFGLHGAYWHDNFWYTMSHGCINMRQIDAGTLFDWADAPANGQKGTAVSVCNSFIEPDTCIQKQPINP
ncbi:L,D-transpeptidase [Candidatus Gottesmanbacteria bacterium]|nr:L,D-transpeptidase [Candidatus Gottesmanbacteria bacterium]